MATISNISETNPKMNYKFRERVNVNNKLEISYADWVKGKRPVLDVGPNKDKPTQIVCSDYQEYLKAFTYQRKHNRGFVESQIDEHEMIRPYFDIDAKTSEYATRSDAMKDYQALIEFISQSFDMSISDLIATHGKSQGKWFSFHVFSQIHKTTRADLRRWSETIPKSDFKLLDRSVYGGTPHLRHHSTPKITYDSVQAVEEYWIVNPEQDSEVDVAIEDTLVRINPDDTTINHIWKFHAPEKHTVIASSQNSEKAASENAGDDAEEIELFKESPYWKDCFRYDGFSKGYWSFKANQSWTCDACNKVHTNNSNRIFICRKQRASKKGNKGDLMYFCRQTCTGAVIQQVATVDTTEQEFNEMYGVWTDLEAAQRIYKMYPNWVNCNKNLYVFNDETGMWEDDTSSYYNIFIKLKDHLHVLTKGKFGETDISKLSYGNTENLMKRLPNIIKSLCVNNDWLRQKAESSLGKILFKNGVYDFTEGKFYDKATYGFNPDVVFMGRIHNDFVIPTDDTIAYMEDIKHRIFYQVLGKEVGDYFISNLSRGLAGDGIRMKRILFGLGVSNSGKGVLTTACMKALGDYVGSFNAGNLVHRNTSQEEAQIMRWALLLRFKRIIISNELKSDTVLDGTQIKKISSGGDELVGRQMQKEEVEFVSHFLPIILANDLPKIKPYDDAVNTRLRILTYNKTFVDEPSNEFELKNDPSIKDEITTPKFQSAFVHILLRSYADYIHNKRVEIEPIEVMEAKQDWVEESTSVITDFLEDFEFTDDTRDYVLSEDIKKWLDGKKLGITFNKFVMELKKYSAIKKFRNVDRFVKRIGNKTPKAWMGIKILAGGYEGEEELP
jgi:hypothetical protein